MDAKIGVGFVGLIVTQDRRRDPLDPGIVLLAKDGLLAFDRTPQRLADDQRKAMGFEVGIKRRKVFSRRIGHGAIHQEFLFVFGNQRDFDKTKRQQLTLIHEQDLARQGARDAALKIRKCEAGFFGRE